MGAKGRSGIDIDFFISSEPYDDDITFKLAQAVSERWNDIRSSELLVNGGFSKRPRKNMWAYGSRRKRFKRILINLPLFHNRVMLIYPKLTPPEFKVTDITENSIFALFSKEKAFRIL
jgi:hypothetical protein